MFENLVNQEVGKTGFNISVRNARFENLVNQEVGKTRS